jgi:glycosyltransferase involved in cell wall biosynthesis
LLQNFQKIDDMEVSVIVPVYNAAPWLADAVFSLVNQEYAHEVILSEDGSSDNSLAVCAALAEANPKVKLVRHPDGGNHGAGASRNLGVLNAQYDLIAFLDADDICLPNRFNTPISVLKQNPLVDGVYEAIGTMFQNQQAKDIWDTKNWGELTTVRKILKPDELFYFLVMWEAGHFSLDGLLIKKELFLKVGGFDEPLKLGEDSNFCMKAAALGVLVPGRLDKPVALRRVHDSNSIFRLRRDTLAHQFLGWRTLNEWAKVTEQPRGKKLLVRYQFWRVLARHHKRNRNFSSALFYYIMSRLMGFEISMRRKLFGPASF